MAEGKPSPRDNGAQKRGPPKTSTRVQGEGRAAGVEKKVGKPRSPEGRAGVDEMEGLFVDAAPESKKSKASRASNRRRERGQAPPPVGVPDTRTSMPAREKEERLAKSQVSELNPRNFSKANLTCTRGPEEGLSLNLIEGSYTVGRARENSFVLKDIAASRRHLRIDVDARGNARVIDLGSGNGTRINGRRLSEQDLKHGDRIEIGGSVLLYQERGKPNNDANGNAPVDDAQERVIRAAEKLAAELSERMRFGDESQSGFEDGHVAKTRAIPPAQKREMDAEIARAKQAQAQAKPEKLWKETFTNLPLDKVVPADEPLRGPRAAESMPAPQQPPQVAQRAPLPRPAPLPMPPPPMDEIEISASTSRGGSFMVSLLVTALVVVLGGGAVLLAFAVTRHRGAEAEQGAEESAAYDDAIAKCDKAMDQEDWATALQYATTAVQLRPTDKFALRYQREAKKHLDDLRKPTLAPAPPAPSPVAPAPTAPAPGPSTSLTPSTAAPPAPVAASAPPAPSPSPSPPPAPKPKPKVTASSSPPTSTPASTPAAAPAPKPKKSGGGRGTMTDDAAQTRFEDAVNALRDKDNKKGCKILEEIGDKAQPDSRWKEKAENLYSRRCGD